jgi:hypothetical protein
MVVMAVDFPNSPQVNQQFTVGDKTYVWTGFVWRAVAASLTESPTFTGTTTTYDLDVYQDLDVVGNTTVSNLTVSGDLVVAGTTTTISAVDLEVEDPLIYIASGNVGNVNDIGLVGHFNDGIYQHSGLVRDASENKWKLFKGVTTEPSATIDFASGVLDSLAVANIETETATIGGATFTGQITFAEGATVTGGATLTLPSQSGNSGKYLKTDGSIASWQNVDSLPLQTGNSGKYLKTNGTTATWEVSDGLPAQTGYNGRILTTNGTSAAWDYQLTTPDPAKPVLIISGAASQTANLQEWKNSAGTNVGYIDNSGNFVAAGDITTNSDQRLKTNISTLENALYRVTKLEGVTYNLKSDPEGKAHTGLIAQDVEYVIPEAVSENEDGIKSVAYGNLVGLLVEAIKEQQVQINELRSRLDGI